MFVSYILLQTPSGSALTVVPIYYVSQLHVIGQLLLFLGNNWRDFAQVWQPHDILYYPQEWAG